MSLNKFTIQKSFAISAGAGSGKTYTLSRRYINALLGFDYFREDYTTQKSYFEELKPAKVKQIVTITYTEAAALEMRGRIFELVSKIINTKLERGDSDYSSIEEADANISNEAQIYVRETLTQAFGESSNAKISTIHAYCLNIIKANADIAKIDTQLDIIKEDEKAKELSAIIFDVLNDEENRETVLDISQDVSIYFMENLIHSYASSSKFRKDYDSFSQGSISEAQYRELIYELYPLPEIDEVREELKDDAVRLQWFETYYSNFVDFKAVAWNQINTDEKTPRLGAKKFPETDAIKKSLEGLIQHYSVIDADKERLFFDKIEKIKRILQKIKNSYDERLADLGKIDFDTIISKTLEIMPEVKPDFKYIMVDEFQDTNATQFEIIKNSTNSDTNLFVVGDSKQSIYGFQGAEIEVFHDAVHDEGLFATIEDMSINYRSDGVVLDMVNKIFKPLLQRDDTLKIISQNYEAEPQNLEVSRESKREQGSFKYLITSNPYGEEKRSELDTIAEFVATIYHGENSDYADISKLITKREKAIAIVFDSRTKMLELKQKLNERGVTAKVSASENFYHTREINDIFNVLKAIDILSRKPAHFSHAQRYYIVAAMRSNIIRVSDNEIKQHLDGATVDSRLVEYVEQFTTLSLAEAVKYIYDDSNIMGVYAHLDDVEQRVANLYKFLTLCREYEEGSEANLYRFLALIENAIYFSEAKEDEAFFQSDNTKSIEVCTIHSTKGLAYPLVLLGNADKSLYSLIASDRLKHNNFKIHKESKEIVGFKINDYVPLSHRVLIRIDKMKHLAEKKRLLYVALTRAEHAVVISALLKEKKDGGVSLRADSYLSMITDALEIEVDALFGQDERYCIVQRDEQSRAKEAKKVTYIDHTLEALTFHSQKAQSATASDESDDVAYIDTKAANLGTLTHKIIELYWDSFETNREAILDKVGLFDTEQRESIVESMRRFYASDIYALLRDGTQHHFELEFNTDDKRGFIDFIYFDAVRKGWVIVDFKTGSENKSKSKKYQEQLNFYQSVMEELGYEIVESRLLWV